MASAPSKRKSEGLTAGSTSKKRKNWQTPKQARQSKDGEIHIGDAGIWVTCERGRENKCGFEVLDLFNDYASRLYQDAQADEDADAEDEVSDIEKAISSEIKDMKKAKSTSFFKVIQLDIACVFFVKTRKPVDPVHLVHSICKDVDTGVAARTCRFAKRLTPATNTEKAHEKNYEDLARKILEPVFHDVNAGSKKASFHFLFNVRKLTRQFAIQFTSRNHHVLSRDDVIKTTAALVGTQHKVDLKNPDFLILVDFFKNICTMAVVSGEYFALKRYNLSELGSNSREDMDNNASSRVVQGTGAPPRQPQIAEDKEEEKPGEITES